MRTTAAANSVRNDGRRASTLAEAGDKTWDQHLGFHAIDRKDVDVTKRLLESRTARGQLSDARVRGYQRAVRLGLPDDGGECVSGFVAQGGHIDDIDGERLLAQVGFFQQGVRTSECKDGGVAIMRGNKDRSTRRDPVVS